MAVLATLAVSSPALFAGAKTDGSAGPVVALSGQFRVPQTLGTLAGGNRKLACRRREGGKP